MVWEGIAAKVGLDAAKGGFETIQKSVSKRKYKAFISAAVAELLAAQATGVPPSPEFLRAHTMLKKTKAYAKEAGKKPASRRPAKRSAKGRSAKPRGK